MTNSNNAATHYADTFKGWSGEKAKLLGPKPTAETLDAVHKLGARPGKQALAIAMGLRETGITAAQMQIACGAPQLNKMRGFITDAFLKRVAAPKVDGHTCYKLELTAKGKQRIERAEKALAKAEAAGAAEGEPKAKAKAKGTRNAKQANTPVQPVTGTSEAASVTVTVPDTADATVQA